MDIQVVQELDLRGLECPMPLLKTKLALNALGPGDVLKVAATDPASEKDFYLFANQSSNRIITFQKEKEAYFYWIEKG